MDLRRNGSEGVGGDPEGVGKAWVSFSSLNPAYVGTVHACGEGKLLLRQTTLLSQRSYRGTKAAWRADRVDMGRPSSLDDTSWRAISPADCCSRWIRRLGLIQGSEGKGPGAT